MTAEKATHTKPASILMPQGDSVHAALRNRGHPLNIKVTHATQPGDEMPHTDFFETIGRLKFSFPLGHRAATNQLQQMLRHHPQLIRIDGTDIQQTEPESREAFVTLTGNAGHYPQSLVSSRVIVNGRGSVIVDGVSYNYRDYQSQRNRTRLQFTYLTSSETADPEHPNCRRVFRLQGMPSLTAITEGKDAEQPPARAEHEDLATLHIAHGLKGSPMQKQAQQQKQAQVQHPPMPDGNTLYQLWEPYHRYLDEKWDADPRTPDDVQYFNMCTLEDEAKAVHLERGDERHNAATAYALWRNPDLELTPVMRRRTKVRPSASTQDTKRGATLEKATAVLPDGQIHDLMTRVDSTRGFVKHASSIELTLQIQEPDGSKTTVVAPAPIYFDGTPGTEQIWIAPDSGLMPELDSLSCLIENAYWDENWETAGCEHHEQRRERTDALAKRCIIGELDAFQDEIERAARGFQPVAELPDREIRSRHDLPNGGTVTVTYRPPPDED